MNRREVLELSAIVGAAVVSTAAADTPKSESQPMKVHSHEATGTNKYLGDDEIGSRRKSASRITRIWSRRKCKPQKSFTALWWISSTRAAPSFWN